MGRDRCQAKHVRKVMSIQQDGTTYLTPDVLASLDVEAAEKFLNKNLDIHVVGEHDGEDTTKQ